MQRTVERSEGGGGRRLSHRLSFTAGLEEYRQQQQQQLMAASPASAPASPSVRRFSVSSSSTVAPMASLLSLPTSRLSLSDKTTDTTTTTTRCTTTTTTTQRASVGCSVVGERTAVLSARWLQMMDEQPQQSTQSHPVNTRKLLESDGPHVAESREGQQRETRAEEGKEEEEGEERTEDGEEEVEQAEDGDSLDQRRMSVASSLAIGDCTADIAAMLEAVLMDGQSTDEAMHTYFKQSNERRELQRQQRLMEHTEEDDGVGDSDSRVSADEQPVLATSPVQLSPSTSLPAHSSPASTWSPSSPHRPVAASSAAVSAAGHSSPLSVSPSSLPPSLVESSDTVSGLSSFLDSAFHSLGVSSMDDSNLHAKLRKRDSSFQPTALSEDNCTGTGEREESEEEQQGRGGVGAAAAAAAGGNNTDSLLAAIVRSVLAGEEADELQSACLQLMDVNSQLRDESAERHTALAQLHTATAVTEAEGSRSALHRFLSDIAQSAAANTARPPPSPLLCRAVSSHYNQCVQYARLSWLQWQCALSGSSVSRLDVSCRQVEADIDMAGEMAAMQSRMSQVRQAALHSTAINRSRQAALATHRRYMDVQLQLASLAEQTATQQWLEGGMAVELRDRAVELQSAARSVEHQLSDGQQRRRARSVLSALTAAGHCHIASATQSQLDISLQAAPFITLRCARIDETEREPSGASDGSHHCADYYYQLTRLSNEKPQHEADSSHLSACLLHALQIAVDGALSTDGVHVPLSSVAVLVRRCSAFVHRAIQWQGSIDAVSKQYGPRLVVSLVTPSSANSDFSLSVRCLSSCRQHQLICKMTVSLTVEPRQLNSVVACAIRAVSLTPSFDLDRVKQQFWEWMHSSRVAGYGQLQSIVGKLFNLLSVL